MLEQLQGHLSKIIKNIKGQGKISESNISDVLRDIRIALLEADVNLKVAKKFVEHVKDKALGEEVLKSVTPGQQFTKILFDELKYFLGDESKGITFDSSGQTIIVLAGLQGCGKTTTCAKLASFLKKKGKVPYLIAADLQRPAAIQQLETLAKSIDVDIFSQNISDPSKVVVSGLKEATKLNKDVIIIDTAGRLHVDDEMMSQLESIVQVSKPHEILFVADGMTGQDAIVSSQAFNDSVDITGIILTKMDGDAKGGAALSIKDIIDKPIKFIGTGEKMEALDAFHPARMADRILGMGDVVSLVERAQQQFDEEEARKVQKKIAKNKFGFDDFLNQIQQIKKMGDMKDLVGMIPGAGKMMKDVDIDDDSFRHIEAIIHSMTPKERSNPALIDHSRKKRISKGSGTSLDDVNQLMKQFSQMNKMMRMMQTMGSDKMMQMMQNAKK